MAHPSNSRFPPPTAPHTTPARSDDRFAFRSCRCCSSLRGSCSSAWAEWPPRSFTDLTTCRWRMKRFRFGFGFLSAQNDVVEGVRGVYVGRMFSRHRRVYLHRDGCLAGSEKRWICVKLSYIYIYICVMLCGYLPGRPNICNRLLCPT